MANGASSCNLSKYKIWIKNANHMKTPNMLSKTKTQAPLYGTSNETPLVNNCSSRYTNKPSRLKLS